MNELIPIINETMDLSQCRDKWTLNAERGCWCLEDVIYTPTPVMPKFQRLSIFVPASLVNADGTFKESAKNVPVVFENNSAGYMQMPHVWLDGPRCYAQQYLDHGLIYVSAGCRGRNSVNSEGQNVGKGPSSLVDLKTAIRFLRHNRNVLPGDFDRIISVGWSAGGAMSSLIAVTGDNAAYIPYLEANGAFMDESDAVYAAQIYCPIIDLEHADMAYEWMFHADKESEACMSGPSEIMSPFKDALSKVLSDKYVEYFNSLELVDPISGEPLRINDDGRSGSAYDYLMNCLSASATEYLSKLESGQLPMQCTPEQYLSGDYTYMARAPRTQGPPPSADAHHAGPGVELPAQGGRPAAAPTLGDMVARTPGVPPRPQFKPQMVEKKGENKQAWLSWNDGIAQVKDLDSYVLSHRRRMKPCTPFDDLNKRSSENHAFGTPQVDYMHFSPTVVQALAELKDAFPKEYGEYYAAFASDAADADLAERVRLINPMSFIGTGEQCSQAKHYRIRVGAMDADTSFMISLSLALKLAKYGCGTVDYALVWDQPHSEADYPGDVLAWIDSICK